MRSREVTSTRIVSERFGRLSPSRRRSGGDKGRGRQQLRALESRRGLLAHIDAFELHAELGDEIGIVPRRLHRMRFDPGKDQLDAVDRGQDEADELRRGGGAVAQPADDGLRRMGKRLQPSETEKAAGALDGVHQAENARDDGRVRRIDLELDELRTRRVEVFRGFGEEVVEKLVHVQPRWRPEQA